MLVKPGLKLELADQVLSQFFCISVSVLQANSTVYPRSKLHVESIFKC